MRKFYLYIISVLLLLTSCEQKDLCFDHPSHTPRVELKVNLSFDRAWEYNTADYMDWLHGWDVEKYIWPYETLRPAEPEGVRLHAYYYDEMAVERNMTKDKSSVTLKEEGYYDLLLYNNDTEYIVFKDLHSFATANATTRAKTRPTYRGNPLIKRAPKEVTVGQPDMLYGAYIDSVYMERSLVTDTIDVQMKPLVFTYVIRFNVVKGAEHLAQAKGALVGMSEGVNLGSGRTSAGEVTILFDCEVVDKFGVQGKVKSFGIPDYPNVHYTRATPQFGLSVELLLKNGNFQQHDFDVTDQVMMQPHGGVIVIDGIEIDETIDESGGGFQVDVDDWGNDVDVPLPI